MLMIYIHTEQERERDKDQERYQWVLIYNAEMFTLVWHGNKNHDPLFPIVLGPVLPWS